MRTDTEAREVATTLLLQIPKPTISALQVRRNGGATYEALDNGDVRVDLPVGTPASMSWRKVRITYVWAWDDYTVEALRGTLDLTAAGTGLDVEECGQWTHVHVESLNDVVIAAARAVGCHPRLP